MEYTEYIIYAIAAIIALALAVTLYILPFIIAAVRNHQNKKSILLINVFLGFTSIGWLVALIWAFLDDIKKENDVNEKRN